MAYNLMLGLIRRGKKTKAQLAKMANVYVAAGQLTEDEYMEVMELVNALEA